MIFKKKASFSSIYMVATMLFFNFFTLSFANETSNQNLLKRKDTAYFSENSSNNKSERAHKQKIVQNNCAKTIQKRSDLPVSPHENSLPNLNSSKPYSLKMDFIPNALTYHSTVFSSKKKKFSESLKATTSRSIPSFSFSSTNVISKQRKKVLPTSKKIIALEETSKKNSSTVTIATVSTVLAIVIFLTIVGNIFVVAAVSNDRTLRQNPANLLVASLAFADLMVASLVMPIAAIYEVFSLYL